MSNINLCAAGKDGWCPKCRVQCEPEENSCVQVEQEISLFNDDNEFDYDKYSE